jgi:hypothetical protein
MAGLSKDSWFTYTEDELQLCRVLMHFQLETESIDAENRACDNRLSLLEEAAIKLAKKKGITDEQLELIRLHSNNSGVSRLTRRAPIPSWEDVVRESEAAVPGIVTLEDICSKRDFEEAFRYLDEIDSEFKHKTRLTKIDLAFLVIALALQCARQYVLQPFLDKHRLTHTQNDKLIKNSILSRHNLTDFLLPAVWLEAGNPHEYCICAGFLFAVHRTFTRRFAARGAKMVPALHKEV